MPEDEDTIHIDVIKWLYGLLIIAVIVFLVASALAFYKTRGISPKMVVPSQGQSTPASTSKPSGKGYVVKAGEIKGPEANGSVFTDQIFRSLVVSPTNPDIVYVGTEGNGAFKSTDGGENWNWLRRGFLTGKACDSSQESYGKIYDLVINPKNENIMYAAVTCGPESPEQSMGGVYKSTDGGQNWVQKISGLPNAGINSIALDSKNPDIIYIGTNNEKPAPSGQELPGGIFKSSNGAESWEALDIPAKGQKNRIDSIVIKNGIVFAIGCKYTEGENQRIPDSANAMGLIKSLDSGKTWQVVNPPGAYIENFDVSADGRTIIAAEDKNGGYMSTNGGESWKSLNINKPVRINPTDENIVFTGSLYKSNVNLSNKTRVLTPEGNAWVSDVEIAVSSPKIIYAVTPGYIVYKSTNAGSSFTKMVNLRDRINN